jgi:predicted nucleotide-binding protein (sugar kinase/HSP70/actin superfamily)
MGYIKIFEEFNNTFDTLDDFVKHYIKNPKTFIIGSGGLKLSNKDDFSEVKKFVSKSIRKMVYHHFMDWNFYYNYNDIDGKKECLYLLDEFLNEIFKNFGVFYEKWMTDDLKPYPESKSTGFAIKEDKEKKAELYLIKNASSELKESYLRYLKSYAGTKPNKNWDDFVEIDK